MYPFRIRNTDLSSITFLILFEILFKIRIKRINVPDHHRFVRAGEGKAPGPHLLAVKQLASKKTAWYLLHIHSRMKKLALGIAKVISPIKNIHFWNILID
jgi:hypothetical protein